MKVIEAVTIGIGFGLVVTFVMINVLTGCKDWSEPNCVSPKQIILEVLR